MHKIAVIGAGPAGMLAAIRAAELKQEVILVEKNSILGKKLLLSGKGRCNLTNLCDPNTFLEKFSKNGQFLRDAFKKFFNRDLINFFEKRGLGLKTERQLRVFPSTDKSTSIVSVLKKELLKNKVKIICSAKLRDILTQDGKIRGLLLGNQQQLPVDKVILATGGTSYGFTGSTGEGMEIARKLGHTIIPLRAGLVPLETKEKYPKDLKGLTLRNIRLKFSDGRRQIVSGIGELLFTGFGISGPLVLTYSGQVVDWLMENRNVYVDIDLKPALTREQLDSRILRENALNSKRTVKNMLKQLLPKSMIGIFLDIAKVAADKKSGQITQVERRTIVSLLKSFRLNISKSRPVEEAMVTKGGISLKEINPRTLESRLIKGLYFAGEIMDVDADTGGFNMQAAFSTGYLVGESAALSP